MFSAQSFHFSLTLQVVEICKGYSG